MVANHIEDADEAVVEDRGKGDGKGPRQGTKRDASGGVKKPAELSDDSLHHNTSDGSRICWNYNLK